MSDPDRQTLSTSFFHWKRRLKRRLRNLELLIIAVMLCEVIIAIAAEMMFPGTGIYFIVAMAATPIALQMALEGEKK